jgi:peptidoglycan/LPS O-acetylase OafA/YrhL
MIKDKHITEIDVLRFFAIFPVILLHFNTNYCRYLDASPSGNTFYCADNSFIHKIFGFGGWGVELFFVISGFVIFMQIESLFNQRPGSYIGIFYYRRIRRIFVPLVVSSALIYYFSIALGRYSVESSIREFMITIIPVKNLVDGVYSYVNPVSWSLETELQFYLIFPLIWFLLIKFSWPLKVFICLTVICCINFFWNYRIFGLYWDRSVVLYLPFFYLGIVCYIIVFKSNFYKK